MHIHQVKRRLLNNNHSNNNSGINTTTTDNNSNTRMNIYIGLAMTLLCFQLGHKHEHDHICNILRTISKYLNKTSTVSEMKHSLCSWEF